MLTAEQRATLLGVARASIKAAACGRTYQPVCEEAALRAPRAVFVTLRKLGELRGCIGTVEPVAPLVEAVAEMARESATSDFRFEPISPEEVPDLDIEISMLTPAERVTDMHAIEIGRHGLIIERGAQRGLLLPQVPVEWGWDVDQFLAHTCLKAGLPRDAWRRGAEVYCFTAEVFGEEEETDADARGCSADERG